MTNETMIRNRRAAAYSAHLARRRARADRQKDHLARLTLAAAVIFFLWAVSLALVVTA